EPRARRRALPRGPHRRWPARCEHVEARVKRRVAVTGMGVVTPIGVGVDGFAAALKAGRSGAGPITLFDPAELPTRIAAQVPWTGPILRDRKVTFALEAARQALEGARPPGTGGLSLGIGLELFSLDDLAARARPGFVAPATRAERLT